MDRTRIALELRRWPADHSTEITLRGSVVATPSRSSFTRLLAILASWQGGPVEVVLSVVGTDEEIRWAAMCDDVLRAVPAHHAAIRIAIRGITEAAAIGHER